MRMKMKRVFRRNQIIITTLAIMIAAAGYLNYAGKSDLPGADTYEAWATKISDSDIYSENQAVSGSVADGEYEEIASLDDPGEGDPLAVGSEEGTAQGAADGEEASADNPAVDNPGEAVLTGGTGVAEYIANVQLSREQIRAKNREALNALINNENLDAWLKEPERERLIVTRGSDCHSTQQIGLEDFVIDGEVKNSTELAQALKKLV